jgi:hypothetical protein
MHLIVIAECVCNVSPLPRGRCRFAPKGGLEADDARVQLGGDPDLVAKAPLKLAEAQTGGISQVGYSNTSGTRKNLRRGLSDGANGLTNRKLGIQVFVRDTDTSGKQ